MKCDTRPATPDSAPNTQAARRPSSGTTGELTVVLADDHDTFRAGLARALRQNDEVGRVIEVSSGRDVVAETRQAQPDVTVIDLRMPPYNGLDLAAELRNDPSCAATKVVILSAGIDAQIIARSEDVGATICLDKIRERKALCAEIIDAATTDHRPAPTTESHSAGHPSNHGRRPGG